MPRKQQSTHKDKRAGKSKANLGQTEAELEKTGKEQMSHMEGGKATKTAQQPSSHQRAASSSNNVCAPPQRRRAAAE